MNDGPSCTPWVSSSTKFLNFCWDLKDWLLHKFNKVTLHSQKFRPSEQKKLILNLGGFVNGGFALTCGCGSTEFDEIATTANPFWTFHQLHQLISHNLACQKSNNPLTSNEPKIALFKHAGILCSTSNILFVLGLRDHKELKNTNMISSVGSLVCRMGRI